MSEANTVPLYNSVIGSIKITKKNRNTSIEVHRHKYIELVYMLQGKAEQIINGKRYLAERGDLLFFNIGDTHAVNPIGEIVVVNIEMKPEFISDKLSSCFDALDLLTLSSFRAFTDSVKHYLPKASFRGRDFVSLEHIIDELIEEYDSENPGRDTVLKSYMNILFVRLLRQNANTGDYIKNNLHNVMPQIIKYIEDNYDNSITLNQLAENSFYNPAYFGRIFKECFGESPNEYINRKRVSEAAKLLEKEDCSIEYIAHKVGYKDKKHFYTTFKKYLGVTPGEYRKKYNLPTEGF